MPAADTPETSSAPPSLIPVFQQMVAELQANDVLEAERNALLDKIRVNKSISSIALVYERMRNAVGYQQEHLLRRLAIDRYFRRRVALRQPVAEMGDSVVRELVRSGYLKNNTLPDSVIGEVQWVIDRYAVIFPTVSGELHEQLLGLLSFEIERTVASHKREEIIFVAFYRYLENHLKIETEAEQALLLCTLYEVLFQADSAVTLYYLVHFFLPEWCQTDPQQAEQRREALSAAIAQAETVMHTSGSQKEQLVKLAKRCYPLFLVLRTIVVQQPAHYSEVLAQPSKLVAQVYEVATRYRTEAVSSLRRGATKAVIFVAITKVTLGIVLEIPYDLYARGQINYVPLFLNLFTPLALMILSVFLASVPGPENTNRLTLLMQELLYQEDSEVIDTMLRKRRSVLGQAVNNVLNWWYTATFVAVCAGLVWLLWRLDFTIVSGMLFFFFLSTVSFLAFRIRTSISELTVYHEDERGLVVVSDFLLLPFLRVGYWLSASLKRANVFLFLFDFVLETPFKSLLELSEQWILFVREKKDEMLS